MFFSKIKEALTTKINNIFKVNANEDLDEIIDELEETLILSDMGTTISMSICDSLREKFKKASEVTKEDIVQELKNELLEMVEKYSYGAEETLPKVILVVGVNGVGKTTSIAKIANMYKKQGKNVLLVAGDTFRAGAIDQLKYWAEKLDIECISGEEAADPASVIYDGVTKFVRTGADVVICDTAGRLHNKKNLMDEIEKIKRTVDKASNGITQEVLMVIDATTGQNAVEQAKAFLNKTNVDNIMLTKLDSTAKGGVVFGIMDTLNIPIKYIGVGEKAEDIQMFNAKEFVEGIL